MFVNFKNAARLAGVGIGIASLAASPAFAQSTAAPEVQVKAPAATAANMMIVRDPVTGQLRAPTAEEAAALQQTPAAAARAGRAASAQASPSAPNAPLTKSHSNGARGVRLTDEMATYSVATRRADGTLEIEHVEGKKAAVAEVQAAKVAPAVPAVPTE